MESLALPRQLVQEILHQAQIAPAGITRGLVVRGSDGKLGLWQAEPETLPEQLRKEIASRHKTLIAIYSSSMSADADAGHLGTWETLAPLVLRVFLGTKGVLQLRGWRSQAGTLQPVDVSLSDEPPG